MKNVITIAKNAVGDTEQLALFVSKEVRFLAAVGKAAIEINNEQQSDRTAYLLEEAILEIRNQLSR